MRLHLKWFSDISCVNEGALTVKRIPTGLWVVRIAIRVDFERALAECFVDFFFAGLMGDTEEVIGAGRFC